MNGNTGGHAVVLGASMGGLAAAGALADRFEHVTIIERDVLPRKAATRRGVPQGKHAHGLLARGLEAYEELFEGLTSDLIERGAVPTGDVGLSTRWIFDGRTLVETEAGFAGLCLSRPLFESYVSERVAAMENVEIVEGCAVHGLVHEGGWVRGVQVMRTKRDSSEETIEAELVVDATGRGSRTPAWLEGLGYPAPAVDEVGVGISYATFTFPRRPDDLDGGVMVGLVPNPPDHRFGIALAAEGNAWTVTIGSYVGEPIPSDIAGFIDHTSKLSAPDLYDMIRDREPIGPGATFRFPASRRRRYERVSSVPERFLVFGDAITSFNPVYAQGMTVAALEALELRRIVEDGVDGLWKRFFRAVTPVVNSAWDMSAGGDFRFPEIAGKRTPKIRMANRYMHRLQAAAAADPAVARAFHDVAHMKARPESVMRPSIARRVLTFRVPHHQANGNRATRRAPKPSERV